MLTEKEIRKLLEEAQHELYRNSSPEQKARICGQLQAYRKVLEQ